MRQSNQVKTLQAEIDRLQERIRALTELSDSIGYFMECKPLTGPGDGFGCGRTVFVPVRSSPPADWMINWLEVGGLVYVCDACADCHQRVLLSSGYLRLGNRPAKLSSSGRSGSTSPPA